MGSLDHGPPAPLDGLRKSLQGMLACVCVGVRGEGEGLPVPHLRLLFAAFSSLTSMREGPCS